MPGFALLAHIQGPQGHLGALPLIPGLQSQQWMLNIFNVQSGIARCLKN